MKRRLASPENEWRDFTDDHAQLKEQLLGAINDIDQGHERDPIALVGPYRTGKTQLLYEGFNNAWEDGIPALYTDANTIFNEFDNSENASISEWLSNRVSAQVDDLAEGEVVDWLPNWNHISDKEEYVQGLSEGISANQTAILLVDEIEQAYTRIREADFVDDDNPLRVLLDDPDGVYQVWAFGLVAAYELGPADYARFQELRVPILDVEDIRTQLQQRRPEVDEQLAPGIWWLSRGRIGWANKLVDEAPETDTEVAEWVRDISTREFEGLTPINNEVWTQEVPSPEWDDARREIMFMHDEYSDWEREGEDAIYASDAADLILKFILELEPELSPDAKQLLEQNVERLMKNIVPVSSRAEGNLYVPGVIFTEEPIVAGFIDLLSDLILSFEASTRDRAQLINALEELDTNSLCSKWRTEFYNHFVNDPPVEPWLPDLQIVNDAYPPVAVDPSRLTEKTTEELRENLSTGITIDPNVSTRATQYEVVFCPTENILQNHIKDALSPDEFSKVYVFFAPSSANGDVDDDEFDRLQELNRINIILNKEDRLWQFVYHLQHYLEQEYEKTGEIQAATVRDVLAEENVRDKRNVISSLFSQLNEIAKSETRSAVRSFEDQFTRHEADRPIWTEQLSGQVGPDVTAPGVYGAQSEVLNMLAFSIGVSRYDLTNYEDIATIESTLNTGVENKFIEVSGNKFGFTQFIESTLTTSGITTDLETFWRRFQREEANSRDESVGNLQDLLLTLLDLSDQSTEDIIKRVKRTDGDSNVENGQIAPLRNSVVTTQLQQQFILGTILEAVAFERFANLPDLFDAPRDRISSGREELERAKNRVSTLNDKLTPPDDYGNSVEIITDPIRNRRSHLGSLGEHVDRLVTLTQDNRGFAGVAVAYFAVVDVYLSLYEKQITTIQNTVQGADLFAVQDLKGTFNQAMQLIEQGSVYNHTNYSEEEALTKLEAYAEEAFDFHASQGGAKIDPLKEEALKSVEEDAEKHEAKIREFNQAFRQLERDFAAMQDSQAKLQTSLADFYADVLATGEGE
ncbi:hypothetical protein BDK88_0098 [Natrinema hispanicum]|uniref:Uncharacterized protein n=1 Tax=Natrinema hispanicum TaxID=392421 RepID=A0A482YHP9_9EURY|nr:hypothetical protein [Natrinema hispanicum]RZV12559.1 hypothetical protein BDK88_0098 [Natrinema hispanicum]